MELGAETALLLSLTNGPGFGFELMARVAEQSDGLLRLNRGGTYLALRRLERRGLVHAWMRRLARGRPRRYYELTPEGILRAEDLRRALAGLTRSSSPGSSEDVHGMADRVREGGRVSADAIQVREAGRRAGLV